MKERRPAAILGFSPTDVNECLTPGRCAHGRCSNLEGSFRCSCEQGYEVTSDGKSCQGTEMLKHPSSTANQPATPPHARAPDPGPAALTALTQTIAARPVLPTVPCTCQSWPVYPTESHTGLNGLFQMSTSVPAGPHAPQASASTPRAPSLARPARAGTG